MSWKRSHWSRQPPREASSQSPCNMGCQIIVVIYAEMMILSRTTAAYPFHLTYDRPWIETEIVKLKSRQQDQDYGDDMHRKRVKRDVKLMSPQPVNGEDGSAYTHWQLIYLQGDG